MTGPDLIGVRRAATVTVGVAALYLLGALAWERGGVSGSAWSLVLVMVLCAGVAVPRLPALLRVAWPLLAWPVLYAATTDVLQMAPQRYIDGWLLRVDQVLVGWWLGLPTSWPLGGPVEEAANAFYVSYYLVVPLGAVWLWQRRSESVAVQYGAGVLMATALCALVWMALPSGGYHLHGGPTTPAWGPFTMAARGVYTVHPHFAAAFPSSHVAVALVVGAALSRASGSRLWLVWAAGVAWSTVQGQYHYVVDVPSGALMGALALFAIKAPQVQARRLVRWGRSVRRQGS